MTTWASLLDGLNVYERFLTLLGQPVTNMSEAGLFSSYYLDFLGNLNYFLQLTLAVVFSSAFLLYSFAAFWWWVFVPALRVISRISHVK